MTDYILHVQYVFDAESVKDAHRKFNEEYMFPPKGFKQIIQFSKTETYEEFRTVHLVKPTQEDA